MSFACCFFCLFRLARAVSRALKRLAKSPAGGSGTASKEGSAGRRKPRTHTFESLILFGITIVSSALQVPNTRLSKLLGRTQAAGQVSSRWIRHCLQERVCRTPTTKNTYVRKPHLLRNHHRQLGPASSKHTIIQTSRTHRNAAPQGLTVNIHSRHCLQGTLCWTETGSPTPLKSRSLGKLNCYLMLCHRLVFKPSMQA